MPSHCFLCRLKGKRCVQLPNHLLCTACQHLRVECMSCLIKVPNAVRKSTEARECLEEAKALASGDPGRAEIALLPKTRQFLSYLQSSLRDTATQSVADPIIFTTNTIFPPAAVLPNRTHEWENGVDTSSAYRVSTVVPPLDALGNVPAINEAPYSALGSSGYVGTNDEAALLHVGSVPYFPNPETSLPVNGSIFYNLAPAFQPMTLNETVTDGEDWSLPMPDNSHDAVSSGGAGPSTAPYPHVNTGLSHETRAETLCNGANVGEYAVDWLRGLAWSMGYYLVPRGAAISARGALV